MIMEDIREGGEWLGSYTVILGYEPVSVGFPDSLCNWNVNLNESEEAVRYLGVD